MKDAASYFPDGFGAQLKQEMFELIQTAHAGQSRNSGRVPYWVHVQSVAEIVEDVLRHSHELDHDNQLALDVYLAAQGHDLYEDTSVQREALKAQFGERVDGFIELLTNRRGDQDRVGYLEQMRSAPEEVKLIKLADLIDNAMSCAYGVHDLGVDWISNVFLPIVREMRDQISRTAFVRYPQTGRVLTDLLEFAFSRLMANSAKFATRGVRLKFETKDP